MSAKPQNKPHRHHYIPCFYLKRWTSSDGRLCRFVRGYEDRVMPRRVAPAATGYVDRLYTLPGVRPELAEQFETNFYAPVDTRAAEVLAAMEAGLPPSDAGQRSAWARFLLSLRFRNPEELAAVRARLAADLQLVGRAEERAYRKQRRPHDPATFREYIAQTDLTPDLTRRTIRLMAETANSERTGEHIINMKWGTLRMPIEQPALMTSDRPLIWDLPLNDPLCHILLPTGPKTVFYAVNSPEMVYQLGRFGPERMIEFVNEAVVSRAVKFVYAMGDNRLAFVQENMGTDIMKPTAERVALMRQRRKQGNLKRK